MMLDATAETEASAYRARLATLQNEVDWLRAANIKLEAALHKIERMPDEDNEWDGRDKFREARNIAKAALAFESESDVSSAQEGK